MDKRRFTRVDLQAEAVLTGENHPPVTGEIENISLRGILVKTAHTFTKDQEIDINIKISGEATNLNFQVKGRVVRDDDDRVGIEFANISLDSFIYLKHIVSFIDGDHEKIEKEFYESFEKGIHPLKLPGNSE